MLVGVGQGGVVRVKGQGKDQEANVERVVDGVEFVSVGGNRENILFGDKKGNVAVYRIKDWV